jgi:hypothetical protein
MAEQKVAAQNLFVDNSVIELPIQAKESTSSSPDSKAQTKNDAFGRADATATASTCVSPPQFEIRNGEVVRVAVAAKAPKRRSAGTSRPSYSKHTGASSPYHGVSFIKKRNRWCAYVNSRGRRKQIGYYLTELEAAAARDSFVIRHGLDKLGKTLNLPPGFKVRKVRKSPFKVQTNESSLEVRTIKSSLAEGKRGRKSSSKFQGVRWVKENQMWEAYLRHGRRIGFFISELSAAKAREAFILKHGFNAPLNWSPPVDILLVYRRTRKPNNVIHNSDSTTTLLLGRLGSVFPRTISTADYNLIKDFRWRMEKSGSITTWVTLCGKKKDVTMNRLLALLRADAAEPVA